MARHPECLILFGAGASKGSGECRPACPPLGSELLDSLHEYNPDLWPSLRDLKIQKEALNQTPFEQLMDEKLNVGFNIVPFQKSLAIFFSRFVALGSDGCYNRTCRSLKGQLMRGAVIFATLNYDLLLDQALSRELGYVNYADSGRAPLLIKVHGSCNWLVEHHMLNVSGEFVHEIKGKEYGKLDFPPLFLFDDQMTLERKIEADKVPPIMRIYASTKPSPTGTSWLEQQEDRMRTSIRNSKRIIVIGARVNRFDDHIWGEIEKTQGTVVIVNRDRASADFLESRGNQNDFWINGHFEDAWRDVVKLAKCSQ